MCSLLAIAATGSVLGGTNGNFNSCHPSPVLAIAAATNGSLVAHLGDTDTMAPAEPTFIDSLSLVDMVTWTSRGMMVIMMAV